MNKTAKLVLYLLLVSFIAIHVHSSPPPPNNIRMTNIPQLNNEEQVFICPTDSNVIIANWRDFRLGFRQIGIGRSTDGGLTWTDSLIARPGMQVFGWDSKQSDPTMTVDAAGNFYQSVLDWDAYGVSNLSTIAFYASTDKGVSWTGPVPCVWSGDPTIFEDKQFITADRTDGVHSGNVYISWTRFPNPDRIVFVRSTDGTATFSDTVVIGPIQTSTGCGESEIDAGQFSIPVVASNGDVHVLWQGYALDSSDECTGSMTIKHAVSADGGVSFSGEDTLLSVSGYSNADGGINTYSQPAADADITGGPFDGNLYVSFTNVGPEDGAGNSDVDFVRSVDNGATWSPRLQINDDPSHQLIDSFHPWLIVNEEGVVIVIFYDQRYDVPNYFLFDCLAAYSFDGGLTFTTNHRLSDVSSSPGDLKVLPNGTPYTVDENGMFGAVAMAPAGLIGEYIGVTAYHDKVNAVWTDSRDGNSEVYTANWYLPMLEPRLIAPVPDAFVGSTPTLDWATSWKHDQDHYRIEIATDDQFTQMVVSQTSDTNLFTPGTALSDGIHYWRVKTFNTALTDSSDYSPVWSFEVDVTPPDMPLLAQPPNATTTGQASPQFSWLAGAKDSPETFTFGISSDPDFPSGPLTQAFPGLTVTDLTLPAPLTSGTTYYWKVTALDGVGLFTESAVWTVTYVEFICGDIDGNGVGPDIADLVYLVTYMFQDGPAPPVMAAADVNGNHVGPDIADLVYLVTFMFQDGPALQCP